MQVIKGRRVTRGILGRVTPSSVVAGLGIKSLKYTPMILMQMANTIAEYFSASTVDSLLNHEANFLKPEALQKHLPQSKDGSVRSGL